MTIFRSWGAVCGLLFLCSGATQVVFAGDDATLLLHGKQVYAQHCADCHGDAGQGDGPRAANMTPRPSDFTLGMFKFRSTQMFDPPSRADVLRVIEDGITGSDGVLMPPFAHLSTEDRLALVDLIRVFAALDEWGQGMTPPPRPAHADLSRGQQLYLDLQCADCHGTTGAGDGPVAFSLEDSNGLPIKPADFRDGAFKGGDLPEDIWLRIYTGLDGTPMPSFGRTLKADELWDLVDYVLQFGNGGS